MPVDLNRLTDGWLELESDPGLFTLLLEDFGVHGVQVEEIYDLQKPIEGPVYGFIFLFKWIEERRSRRKFLSTEECFVQNDDVVNSMFFAQQMVPNSCATHALLSVLLNCKYISIGESLTDFREYTNNMSPENKGLAIGNSPELARAHNSHAKPVATHVNEKSNATSSTTGRTIDAFHFVSYVPIDGHLFELDGLRPFPIDHGPWKAGQDWTEKFRDVITERLGIRTRGEQPYHDIRFNLMAVVPDRRSANESKLKTLKTNRKIVTAALQQLIHETKPELYKQHDFPPFFSPKTRTLMDQQQKLPAELDSHNYAKSPRLQNRSKPSGPNSDSDTTSCDEFEQPTPLLPFKPISVETATDFTTPITIKTHLSPAFSTSSTDTSSEVGSAFNSPNQINRCSDTAKGNERENRSEFLNINKFVCIRMSSNDVDGPTEKNTHDLKPNVSDNFEQSKAESEHKVKNAIEPHKFAPKDLLALLKTLENEISDCEANLKDEIEKRRRYKIDDCRRTHNYDQFITMFLSMLSEQNKLTALVKQNSVAKRHQGHRTGQYFMSRRKDRRKKSRSTKKK